MDITDSLDQLCDGSNLIVLYAIKFVDKHDHPDFGVCEFFLKIAPLVVGRKLFRLSNKF